MTNRRNFIKTAGITGVGLSISMPGKSRSINSNFKSKRPAVEARKFTSKAVEAKIAEMKAVMADEELAWMFENCFPNTLDTTVSCYQKENKPYCYVITGDIDAMWLRDSTAQVWPYLPLANKDPELKNLLKGVVNKQTEFVLVDPYANAFYDDPNKLSKWSKDITVMKPGIHERKYELDSLCYVVRLAHGYWKATGDTSIFDDQWKNAMKLIVKTFREQQRKEDKGPYSFRRTHPSPLTSQFSEGFGNPTKKTGLIHSMFRPSDDATYYPFLVPANMFAEVSLRQLHEIFSIALKEEGFASECLSFAKELDQALKQYAILEHPYAGKIFPFEIDGFGNALFMDDAGIPNLLSLPYLGYCKISDPVYKNSRKFSLSSYNPWYHGGKYGKGIGGPHVGENKIWPMGFIMQAMTSTDDKEILYCLHTLKTTHAGSGFIHETFHVDNPEIFSRKWFAWANTLFGEMIIQLQETKPHLLQKIV